MKVFGKKNLKRKDNKARKNGRCCVKGDCRRLFRLSTTRGSDSIVEAEDREHEQVLEQQH